MDIPEDIMDRARELRQRVNWSSNEAVEEIARALMAERFGPETQLAYLERAINTELDAAKVAWIAHDGGGDPPPGTPDLVQVQFLDGEKGVGRRWDWDQNWCWDETKGAAPGVIVAYRPIVIGATHDR